MESFEIKRLITTFFNKKLYIILVLLLSITLGYFYTYYYVTPMYKSSTTMLLVKGETENSDDSSTITQSDIALNQKLISTYTQIIKSNKVLRNVISNLNLSMNEEELSNSISVSAADNTEIIKLSVVNSNPELAAQIANEIADVFSTEVKELYNIDNVSVIDTAEISNTPYNVNHIKDLLIFAIVGIFISCAIIFIYYLFNKTIKLEEDVEEFTELNVLATIPIYNKTMKITTKTDKTDKTEDSDSFKELITFEDSKSPIAECFRTLRTNLLFTQTEKVIKTILVTSGYMKEGKSWTSANMAVAFAKSNKKVLLIDTDMRKGRQHHIFKVQNNIGLSNCLTVTEKNSKIEIDNLSKYIKETKIPNIHIMTSGNRPPNPSELISSKKMEELLNLVQEMYDIVILDGSPSMVVSDSIILSKLVDTTVIVTANKETKIETLQKLQKSLEAIDAKIGGVIINKMEVSMKTYNSKYYYSDSSHEKEENNNQQLEKIETVNDIIKRYKTKIETTEDIKEDFENIDNIDDYKKIDTAKIENEIIKKVEMKLNKLVVNLPKEDIELKIEELKQYIQASIKQEDISYLEEKIEKLSNIIREELNSQTDNTTSFQTLEESINNRLTDILDNKLLEQKLDIDARIDKIANNTTSEEIIENLINKYQDILDNKLLEQKLDIQNTIDQINNTNTITEETIQNLTSNYQEILNMKLDEYTSNIDDTIEEKVSELKIKDDNEEKFNNIKEEIYNLQTLIASSIVKNNNDEIYNNLESKIEEVLNKTEMEIDLKEKEIKSQEDNVSKLEEEILTIKQDILSIKELLKNNTSNNESDSNNKKVVDIQDLKNNEDEYKKNKSYIKFLNKRSKDEYVYDINEEIHSEDLYKSANQFCQILTPSNVENVAN